MKHLYEVFEDTRRQGPGSEASTLRAYQMLPPGFTPQCIIDLGCGKGETSLLLAKQSGARVVALDNHRPFLDWLAKAARDRGLDGKVSVRCSDMAEPPLPDQSFDLVWSEGSAYAIGFANALSKWRRLLSPGGCLVVSEAVWLTADPAPELLEFWEREYPDLKDRETRLAQARDLGYRVLGSFVMPMEDWDAYYGDLENSLSQAVEKHGPSPALEDLSKEIDMFKKYRGDIGYVFQVLQSG